MMRRLLLSAWFLLVSAFLLVTTYYIIFHHVSPLSRDQWHMYHALFEQGLWRTSISTVSGHRHILAFLLYDIDLEFFNGNNHFLIACDWLLNLGLITLLCAQIWRYIVDPYSRWLLMGWTVLLLCWLLNIALLGWGFNGINNYMSIFNTVLSVFFLHRAVHELPNRARNTIFSVLLAGLATLSFGNGILVWPIALLSLYLWRSPRQFSAIFVVAGLMFFLLYLLMPGGEAVGAALHFNGWEVLLFPLALMGGPFYHLLRAWHVMPEDFLSPVATGFGVLVCLLAVIVLWHRLSRRVPVDRLDALAIVLILIGLGTTFLLMLTRVEGVLDPAVDRFQIWALLVWLGLSLLLYRMVTSVGQMAWKSFFLVFPLLAMPAQLDWGARLAEYRTRVDTALLAYQVYLPVSVDAEKALHWNWQNKLPYLFSVLENLRLNHRNIFSNGAADWLGKPLPVIPDLPTCQWSLVRQEGVMGADLLDVAGLANADAYRVTVDAASQQGLRWYGNVAEQGWEVGLIADSAGVVRGLLQPVRYSRLPRFSGVVHDDYNAYGIARLERPGHELMLLKGGRPWCLASLK